MDNKKITLILLMIICINAYTNAQIKPDTINYKTDVWKSETRADCPFNQSEEVTGIRLLGIKNGFHYGDTWYPTWGSDDN